MSCKIEEKELRVDVHHQQPPPLRGRSLGLTMSVICDVCGRPRGKQGGSHAKCSKIRAKRGFDWMTAGTTQ